MSTVNARLVESTFGPVEDICQDTTRRAEGSNHHQDGGKPMVASNIAANHGAIVATVKAIASRLEAESHRYLLVHRNVQTLSTSGMAELVAEIVSDATAELQRELRRAGEFVEQDARELEIADAELTQAKEIIDRLQSERDELIRQVEDLAWDLADVLSGRPVSSVGAMFTEHDELGGA